MNIVLDTDYFPIAKTMQALMEKTQRAIEASGLVALAEEAQKINDHIVGQYREISRLSLPLGLKVVGSGVVAEPQNKQKAKVLPEPATLPTSYHVKPRPFTVPMEDDMILIHGNVSLNFGKIRTQPSKAIQYITDRIGIQINYAALYDAVRDSERGIYSSTRKKLLSYKDKERRGKSVIDELYKVDGFSSVYTVCTKDGAFYIKQK